MEPNTTFMHELNGGAGATVDARMVPLVKFLNRLQVQTLSSGFHGRYATVTFTGSYKDIGELLFNHFRSMAEHMDGVQFELVWTNEDVMPIGSIHMPIEYLEEFSKRVGGWMEEMRK